MVSKKIILSILTIFFVGCAAAGTWASYSAEDSSVINAKATEFGITAGDWNTWTFPSSATWAPGESITSTVTVTNSGDMQGYLFGDFSVSASGDATQDSALASEVLVSISDENGAIVTDVVANSASLSKIDFNALEADGTNDITVTLKIPDDSGIEVQGGSIDATMAFKLNQLDSYSTEE